MLNHRLRRWPKIEQTMAQCLVFAVLPAWSNVHYSGNTVSKVTAVTFPLKR